MDPWRFFVWGVPNFPHTHGRVRFRSFPTTLLPHWHMPFHLLSDESL